MRAIAAVMIVSSVTLSGCNIFPYSERFGCENMNKFGRCLDVKDAYEMAVTGEVKGQPIVKKGSADPDELPIDQGSESSVITNSDPAEQYQDERYKRLTELVQEPTRPMVKQPEVVRTLVLNYSDQARAGSPLYGHRFFYFFGSDPEWVMGPYQNTPQDNLLPNLVD